MSRHQDLTYVHVPYNWSYADAAAREAAVGLEETDIGKLALQEDDYSLWMLVDDYPAVTWQAIGSATAFHTDEAGEFDELDEKETPVAGDKLLIEDSEDGGEKKWVDWDNLPSGGGGDPSEFILTGDYASLPAAGTEGALYLPTDSAIIARDTGAAWEYWGPIYKFTQPVTGDFSWINQEDASIITANYGVAMLVPNGGSADWRLRVKSAPSTPYTITACFNLSHFPTNSANCGGLVFRESSSGKIVSFAVTGAGKIEIVKWTDANTYSAGYFTVFTPDVSGPIWMQIADDNTNRICYVSPNGQNWLKVHSVSRTDFLTANQVGWGVNPDNRGGVDYNAIMNLFSWKEA